MTNTKATRAEWWAFVEETRAEIAVIKHDIETLARFLALSFEEGTSRDKELDLLAAEIGRLAYEENRS